MESQKKKPKALLLLSSGFDSPVAAHLMKELCNIEAVHFHFEPLTDKTSVKKSKELTKILGIKKLYVFPSAFFQAEINKYCEQKLFFVLTKRMMLRVAERLAKGIGAKFLITGESLGQVASQTLTNLSVIADAVHLPVYRPLLTTDKVDIIKIAKTIGTHNTSLGPEICNILGPKHPATKTKRGRIKHEERKLTIESIIKEVFKGKEEYTF